MSHKPIVILYHSSLSNYIIFGDLIRKYGDQVECVIEFASMPKKTGKAKALFLIPKFVMKLLLLTLPQVVQ